MYGLENFFQHECHLLVRTPRAKLPDGPVQLVKPVGGGPSGFTLPFEALILTLARQMPFAAVARMVGGSACRVMAVCRSHVVPALEAAGFSQAKALAIDETARSRRHDYITLAADALERRVPGVIAGRDAATIKTIATERDEYGCPPDKSLKGLRWALRKDRAALEPKAADPDAPIARMTRERPPEPGSTRSRSRPASSTSPPSILMPDKPLVFQPCLK